MENRIALAGSGNVGTALLELLHEKRGELAEKYGFTYEVTLITDLMKGTVANANGLDLERILREIKTNRTFANMPQTEGTFPELLQASEATMLAEATPTNIKTGEPGLSHIMEALSRGISVTTTNKGPLSVAWDELHETAKKYGAKFRHEGVVMSGTPVVQMLECGLAGASVTGIEGILNGTTNFILTRMYEGAPYAEALAEAQRLGYAEADPGGDIDGWDAAAKVSILARIAFGKKIPLEEIDRIGISGVTPERIAAAKQSGRKTKPVAGIKYVDGALRGYVTPREIPLDHPLASVNGAANAIAVTTDNLGCVTLIGPGAGRRETGQALLADLISMSK